MPCFSDPNTSRAIMCHGPGRCHILTGTKAPTLPFNHSATRHGIVDVSETVRTYLTNRMTKAFAMNVSGRLFNDSKFQQKVFLSANVSECISESD